MQLLKMPVSMSSVNKNKPATEKHVVQPHKKNLLSRLRRIEGQVRGVANMVEEDRYCIDIITQITALRSALDAVALQLLEDHTHHCVKNAVRNGDDSAITELMDVIKRMKK